MKLFTLLGMLVITQGAMAGNIRTIDVSAKQMKTINLNSDMNVQIEGIVLLDYKILGRETKKPQTV